MCFKPKLLKRAFYRIESQAGVNLEILLGAKLDGESCLTDIICRLFNDSLSRII